MTRRPALAVLLALLGSACGLTGPLEVPSPEPTGPYVITAIDYHFHDAHPSRPVSLSRAVAWNSQARNVHNVTIEGTDFSMDLPPGERIEIDPISSLLPEPGRYRFFCAYHVDRGMRGVLVLVP
ncbi:MAG TPA: hypothetical protein VEO00_06065 [Actinomycetota bacterium]|nr:hypothetical protein [Actinomycetota bacterium]